MIIGFISGCQNSSKNSFIIIATDQLSFQDSNCSRDSSEPLSGIGLLCRESVRWTHVFTTSLLSGPALSSLLTGLHPRMTGYRHHGQYLHPQFKNIAQIAVQKKYRTAFFSGGPPILKKSGLDSGFETFDDYINFSQSPFLKPFKESSSRFFDWLDDIGNAPHFSVFYVPDLRFITRNTVSPSGETRNRSFESQLEEFDTTLFDLITRLKKTNRWDKTHFILVGLQGRNLYDRQDLYPNLNLHSESSQVTLLWKPAQTKRDSPVSWTMDKNVSLADVGQTLFELLGTTGPVSEPLASSIGLTLHAMSTNETATPLHLIESAWGQWKLNTPIFSALLNDEELYFHTQPATMYRTLSDRLEVNPINEKPDNQNLFQPYKEAAEKLKLEDFKKSSLQATALWSLGYQEWLAPKLQNVMAVYYHAKPKDVPIEDRIWFARSLIENGEWKKLKQFAEIWQNNSLLWIANKNLGGHFNKEPSCLKLVGKSQSLAADVKKCADPVFLEALTSLEGEKKSRRWEKILEEKLTVVQILKTNRALGFIWDVAEKDDEILSNTELLFWTPEYRNAMRPVQKKIQLIELETP